MQSRGGAEEPVHFLRVSAALREMLFTGLVPARIYGRATSGVTAAMMAPPPVRFWVPTTSVFPGAPLTEVETVPDGVDTDTATVTRASGPVAVTSRTLPDTWSPSWSWRK